LEKVGGGRGGGVNVGKGDGVKWGVETMMGTTMPMNDDNN